MAAFKSAKSAFFVASLLMRHDLALAVRAVKLSTAKRMEVVKVFFIVVIVLSLFFIFLPFLYAYLVRETDLAVSSAGTCCVADKARHAQRISRRYVGMRATVWSAVTTILGKAFGRTVVFQQVKLIVTSFKGKDK
jgi:hypothetical protein